MFRESSDEATLLDIEKTYGKKTSLALDKYCKLFKKNPTDVVSDLKADGNGMTEWDKFDVWAKRKLKLDIMDNFDDTIDWTGAEDEPAKSKEKSKRTPKQRFGNVYDEPSLNDIYGEGSGSRMDEQDVLDFIGEELVSCDWVSNLDYDDVDAKCYIDLNEGTSFEISIKRI